MEFISSADYLCGHNIISHDICYLKPYLRKSYKLIDTLYLSPILFPERPYHNLIKDDKILSDQLNNPLSDSLKAKQLFEDEMERFKESTEVCEIETIIEKEVNILYWWQKLLMWIGIVFSLLFIVKLCLLIKGI